MTGSGAALSRPPRVAGLDVARGLALVGMFAAHVGDAGNCGFESEGWAWLIVADGRSSALFAVLAGVSISLMQSRRTRPDAVAHTRVRVAVRAALLLVLGWTLALLATPVDVILDNLGVMFLLALVALTWPAWVQAVVGAAVLAVGGWVVSAIQGGLVTMGSPGFTTLPHIPGVSELWSTHYPALAWVGYILVGLAIGQWAPWRGRALWVLAIAGTFLAVCAYGAGLILGGSWSDALEVGATPSVPWASVAPHSYTPFEMLGNVGVAAAVIAGCVAATRIPGAGVLTWPLASAGRMTLTLYTAHIVVIAVVGMEMVWNPSNNALVAMSAAAVAAACVWRVTLGQGPLERVLAWASSSVATRVTARRLAAHSATTDHHQG